MASEIAGTLPQTRNTLQSDNGGGDVAHSKCFSLAGYLHKLYLPSRELQIQAA